MKVSKLLSLVLALALVLSCMSIPVFASAEENVPVIRMNMVNFYGNKDEKEVEDAINAILVPKVGAKLDIVGIEFGAWQTQLNLMLTGGPDALDVFTSFWYAPLSQLHANGQVAPLDDLIASQCPELLNLFDSTVLDACRIDGKLYGLPIVGCYSAPNIYAAVLEDSQSANIDWSQVHSLDDVTQAMLAMKAANPTHYYIPGSTETYWIPKGIDDLGDSSNFLGVLTDPLNSTTVENYYESDYFKNLLDNVKIWKENDLISPDPLSNSNPTLVNIQYGIAQGTPGYTTNSMEIWLYENNLSEMYGCKFDGAEISDRIMTTSTVTTYLFHVTPFCKDQEAAIRVLNELYTNPEVAMLLANGIEGKHYVLNENGQITLPEGETATTVGWYTLGGGTLPNTLLCPAQDYQMPDLSERIAQLNAESKPSLALGFVFDSSSVTDQVTACANVIAQYYLPLMYGEVDIDDVLPMFQQALKDAGIDDIISAKQAQLDAWLAAK
ncbi:MAG: ABC transporter substrate-binding protein [Clostridia bacterium]|nr:ABC transporter substrate-binding protein [Clostridia bacterium]